MGSETDVTGRSGMQVHLETFGAVVTIVAGAFLMAIVLSGIGQLVLADLGVSTTAMSRSPALEAFLTTLQYLGFGIAIFAYLHYRNEWDVIRWRVPTLRDLGWVVLGLGVLVVLLVGVSLILQQLGIQTAQNGVETAGNQAPAYYLYLVPITILLIGPTEELIFRGIVQGTFRRSYGPKAAIVLATAVFALIHWGALTGGGGGRLATIAVIFVLGGVLGAVYELSGNVVVTALIHGLFNAVQFLYQYALQTHLL